jgi:hypothetical protein
MMARPAVFALAFVGRSDSFALDVFTVVVDSHGVVVSLPWKVLFGVRLDAFC